MDEYTKEIIKEMKECSALYYVFNCEEGVFFTNEKDTFDYIKKYIESEGYDLSNAEVFFVDGLISIINSDDFLRQHLSIMNIAGVELVDTIPHMTPIEKTSEYYVGFEEATK